MILQFIKGGHRQLYWFCSNVHKNYKSRKKISSRHVLFLIAYLCHKANVFHIVVNIKSENTVFKK
jgi:hypothetical protein